MADWLDDPELYKPAKAPKSGGDDWLDDPSLYSPAPEGFVDSVKRRISEQSAKSLGQRLREIPADALAGGESLVRGIGSGLNTLGGTAALIGGMPVASGLDAIARAGGQPTGYADAVGDYVTGSFRNADSMIANDPRARDPEAMIASSLGAVIPDLTMAYLTGGESAAIKPMVQQSVRQSVARAAEEMVEQGAKASVVPSVERGSQLGTQVIDAGGTPVEALGAFGTGAATNSLAYMVPGAASGSLPVRAIEGAIVEPVAGKMQNDVENLALPDRLGIDQQYDSRAAFMDAFLGGGLSAGMGGRPQERFANPDAMRGTPEDIASREIETALDDETFANRPAAPLGERMALEPVVAPPADADAPFRRPDVPAPVSPEVIAAEAPVAAEPPVAPTAERLYSDYNPEANQTVTRVDGNLSFPESRLTRRALDDALSDPDPVNAAERLLTNIAEQPDIRPEQKWLAETLAPLMKPLGVKLIEPNPSQPYAGAYSNTDNTVYIRQADPETALHETFHGVTSALITNKAARSNPVVGKAVRELDDMLGHLTGALGLGEIDTSGAHPEVQRLLKDKQGPLSNTKEFVTYGLTNRPFQDWLRTLPPPPGRTEARNMWEYFKQAVASMFGKMTPQQRSFLDALIETGADLTNFAAANPTAVKVAQAAEAGKLRPVAEIAATPPAKPPAPKPEPAATPKPERPPTSTKNAFVDADRERAGKPAIEKAAPRSNETTLEMGKAAIADNPDLPAELIARLSVSGVSSINSVEEAALQVESERLRAERDRQADRAADPALTESARAIARQKFDEAEAAIDQIDAATRNSGTEWGRFGQYRQRALRDDYTLAALERKARAVKGEPLTAEETGKLREMADTIAKQQKRLESTQKRLDEYESGAAVAQTYKRLLEDMRKPRGPVDVAALKERAERAKAALRELAGTDAAVMTDAATLTPQQALIDLGAYHYADGGKTLADWTKRMEADVPEKYRDGLSDLFELSKAGAARPVIETGKLTHKNVYDLALAEVRNGVKGEDAVMKAVFEAVKADNPGITERDVRRLFSEYGKATFPSKDADKTAVRELRALVQMQESIDRLTEGLPKLKNGLQRDKATADIIAKRAQLNEMLKAATKKATETQRKAALEAARQENLRKQIELIDEQIFTGERTAKTEAKPVSAEVARLSALRDQLTKERRTIDSPPKSEEQKREEARVRGLESSIQEMRDTLAGKPADPDKPPVTSEKIKSLEKLRDELRAQLDATKAAKNPPMSDAEKRQRRIESGLKRRIKNVEELLLFGKKPKPTAVERGEAAKLLESALEAFTDIRDAIDLRDNPPLTADERYQRTRGKAIARELEKVQARIAAGDYEKSVRIPKELNEANTKAAYELKKAKNSVALWQILEEEKKKTKAQKAWSNTVNLVGLSRAIKASFDLSSTGLQSGMYFASHPIKASKALYDSIKAGISESEASRQYDEIVSRDNARLYDKYGLAIVNDMETDFTKMEEVNMTRWLDKIPEGWKGSLVGAGLGAIKAGPVGAAVGAVAGYKGKQIVKGTQRAYIAMMNKVRADSFDSFMKAKPDASTVELKKMAGAINDMTGRADGKRAADAAVFLNTMMFAPRWLWSRFRVASGIAAMHGGSRATKAYLLREHGRAVAGLASFYALAFIASLLTDREEDDAETVKEKARNFVQTNPLKSGFGDIVINNTHLNPTFGLSSVYSLLARLASGEYVNANNERKPLRNVWTLSSLMSDKEPEEVGFAGKEIADVTSQYMAGKLSPVASYLRGLTTGKSFEPGKPFDPVEEAASSFIPMPFKDTLNYIEDLGVDRGIAVNILKSIGLNANYWNPAAFAPDAEEMSGSERNSYGDYLKEAKKIKKAKTDLQEFANTLPEDMSAGDIRYEVEKKAAELGLEGATVDVYKRDTTARDDKGNRRRGVKRSETGSVKLNWKQAYSLSGYSAADKTVSAIDSDIEALDEDDITNAELEKIYGKYVFSPLTDGGDTQASDDDIESVRKTLRWQRKWSQDNFVKERAK